MVVVVLVPGLLLIYCLFFTNIYRRNIPKESEKKNVKFI